MKPLRIKKRTSDVGADAVSMSQVPSAATKSTSPPPTGGSASPSVDAPPPPAPIAGPSTLVPSPPVSRQGRDSHGPSSSSPSPPPTSADNREQKQPQKHPSDTSRDGAAGVKFASELDNANVDAYLEYLTRPHTSWGSATRHLAHRREVIDNHRASVFARSLASSRHASFASSMRSESSSAFGGGDGVDLNGTVSSVASAPAGFPRTASNASKTYTGKLRKGRLGGDTSAPPAPPNLVAAGSSANSASAPSSSAGLNTTGRSQVKPSGNLESDAGRTTSSHSSVSTGQRAPTNKGRLARGGALTAPPRAKRASASTSAGAAVTSGPDLTIGGTHLQTAGNSLLVGGVSGASTSGRSASRDSGVAPQVAKGKAKGGRKVGSA